MPSPPPIPSNRVVIFDCLSGDTHELLNTPMAFGSSPDCDVQLGAFGVGAGKVVLSRSGKRLSFIVEAGEHHFEVDGAPFEGGLLPEKKEKDKREWSLVIDKRAFFFVKFGDEAVEWGAKLKSASSRCWELNIIEGGIPQFNAWKAQGMPASYPGLHVLNNRSLKELLEEVGKRSWTNQVGVVYHEVGKAGFFASQFLKISKEDEVPDAGDHRCPRCFMRFDIGRILAIHPSEYGDDKLGRDALKRFTPARFDFNGMPLAPDGQPCTRLACPHCRGELPPNFVEKPPHLLSIVGDSMAGKSYFLAVAVRELQGRMRRSLNVSFTDGDPAGNATLSRMVSKLFSSSEKPEDTFLEKTQLAGATYQTLWRYGKEVKLPAPFTYKIYSRDKGASSLVFYDNAGEHFRPNGYTDAEKSNLTEHIAWASGIVFLFDPLQHSDLLRMMKRDADPQVGRMKDEVALMRDQHSILSEMGARIKKWRSSSFGEASEIPLAVVIGKHDLLHEIFPLSELQMDVCKNGAVSHDAIEANSNLAYSFLLDYCPDIVGAAEEVSSNVRYFPASSFGSPAVVLENIKDQNGNPMLGPDPGRLSPYLVEAPFLWLLSQIEPVLVPSS